MGFAKSTDGGVTWTYNNDVYDVNGIRGNLFASGIRVNEMAGFMLPKPKRI